jgi:hypothetical protein
MEFGSAGFDQIGLPRRKVEVRFGSKADIDCRPLMSALPPKADNAERGRDVRFVPFSDEVAANSALFDHLVSANEERSGNCEAERLCRLLIYQQLER